MSTEVPFGKYRGRPVEEMLADDGYMTWLQAQPWFRERFAHLKTAKDEDALSRTPVHNRLQTLFLDEAYQQAFVRTACRRWFEEAFLTAKQVPAASIERMRRAAEEGREWLERVEKAASESKDAQKNAIVRGTFDYKARIEAAMASFETATIALIGAKPRMTTKAAFEMRGADVVIDAVVHAPHACSDAAWDRGISSTSKVVIEEMEWRHNKLLIEIKPTVADEYPAVLRQMNRNKSEFLFIERYQGDGATEAQFVAIFAASGKQVVFKRDVDADV